VSFVAQAQPWTAGLPQAATLRTAVEIGGTLACLMTAPLILELFALTSASLLGAGRPDARARSQRRLTVVVPAHNEGLLIGRCVRSLLPQLGAGAELLVIAHNCSDDTAENARKAGAAVVELTDPAQQGKACALRFGFARAIQGGAEAVAVVDADSVVSDGFVANMQAALSDEAEAVQCRYRVLRSEQESRPTLTEIAFQGFNLVRPRGRERLGLSVGIFGNGFGVRREVLDRVPYRADSVVEDLEYHLAIVEAGFRVRFVENATVYGEMPQGKMGSKTQRARWEGGRVLMLKSLPGRVGEAATHGRTGMVEPVLDLLSLPIAFSVPPLLFAVCLPVPWIRGYGAFGLGVLVFHFLAAARAGSNFWQAVGVLAMAPRYIAWKLMLMPAILLNSRRHASWVRTQRDKPADFTGSVRPDALE